ncbi:MAG TPA: aldo/keto reductase [Anaerolineales bacterium]|nr:aldo/keto reductase [Anaerolineales bacterium]
MHYRRLGRSGLKVSEISLGSWITFGSQVGTETSKKLIQAAYDAGINFFDCADVYAKGKAEIEMGKAIKGLPREALVISSKVFWPTMPGPNGRGLSRKHITESINGSLKRLGVDYLDLYFCHRFDPDTPMEEIVRSMNDLIHQGKILYWGTSEWRAWQISSAFSSANSHHLIAPTMEQPQYNMFHRKRMESELAPICKDLGIGITTWSPLYGGILSGKYKNGIPDGSRAAMEKMDWFKDRITPERQAVVQDLEGIASDLGITVAQLAIAWQLRRKDVSSVITGATKLKQLQQNIDSTEAVEKLTDEVLERIEQALGNQPDEDE